MKKESKELANAGLVDKLCRNDIELMILVYYIRTRTATMPPIYKGTPAPISAEDEWKKTLEEMNSKNARYWKKLDEARYLRETQPKDATMEQIKECIYKARDQRNRGPVSSCYAFGDIGDTHESTLRRNGFEVTRYPLGLLTTVKFAPM